MNRVTLHCGDVLEVLRSLPAESIHMVCTSPPYWSLRDYGVPGQLGLEKTPDEYIEKMVAVLREVRRVLRKDGTLWLNMGDSYSGGTRGSGGPSEKKLTNKGSRFAHHVRPSFNGLKSKDLCMIPARLALALQSDGWWLRSDIIWAKPNPMPESVTDRPTTSHEHIFLMTTAANYYYDADAMREKQVKGAAGSRFDSGKTAIHQLNRTSQKERTESNGRNLRSVWTIATTPFPEAHFATFPTFIPERCIKAGTSEKGVCPKCGAAWQRVVEKKRPPKECYTKTMKPESISAVGDHTVGFGQKYQNWLNDNPPITTGWQPICKCPGAAPIPATVLDPFSGAATTLVVAAKLGRDAVGIELNPAYVAMSVKRLKRELGMLCEIITK